MIIGAMRSGSTFLYEYLNSHPEIAMPLTKELHYFSFNTSPDLKEYATYFENLSHEKLIGEASPEYLYLPHVPEILHNHFPELKVIIVLRNPVKRTYSHYWWAVKSGRHEHLPFSKAIKIEEKRRQTIKDDKKRIRYSYTDRSIYINQLRNVLDVFPREQVHVVILEELVQSPEIELDKLCAFLGISTFHKLPSRHNHAEIPKFITLFLYLPKLKNALKKMKIPGKRFILKWINLFAKNWPRTHKHPKMDSKTHTQLHQYFEPYNNELFELLNKNNIWNKS